MKEKVIEENTYRPRINALGSRVGECFSRFGLGYLKIEKSTQFLTLKIFAGMYCQERESLSPSFYC